ncbi:hypothetical protein IV102_34205 [bacterium]|nr:hypothetical protein [bacterium]
MNRAATTILTGLLCLAPAWAQSAFPPANSTTNTRRPNIGFNFGQAARNMQLFIDGRDWTNESNKNGNVINFLPNWDIDLGQHQVEARAINILGLPIGNRWNFTVANPNNQNPATPSGVTRVAPAHDSTTTELRPRISADYPDTLRNGRIWLDGNEVTSMASLSGGNMGFTPNQDLSPGRHQVATQVTYVSGQNFNYNWTFEVKPPAQQPPSQAFSNLSPPPNARMRNLRPYISADFNINYDNVRLLVDNNDVTNQCERMGNRIAWSPNYDLQPGAHGARVEGRTNNGQVYNSDWNFVLEGTGGQPNTNPTPTEPTDIDFGVDEPLTGDRVRPNFQVEGQGPAGQTVRVSIKPLPKKNKVAQFQGVVDDSGNYSVPIKSPSWAGKNTRLEITVTLLNKRGRPATDPIVLEVYRR